MLKNNKSKCSFGDCDEIPKIAKITLDIGQLRPLTQKTTIPSKHNKYRNL